VGVTLLTIRELQRPAKLARFLALANSTAVAIVAVGSEVGAYKLADTGKDKEAVA